MFKSNAEVYGFGHLPTSFLIDPNSDQRIMKNLIPTQSEIESENIFLHSGVKKHDSRRKENLTAQMMIKSGNCWHRIANRASTVHSTRYLNRQRLKEKSRAVYDEVCSNKMRKEFQIECTRQKPSSRLKNDQASIKPASTSQIPSLPC